MRRRSFIGLVFVFSVLLCAVVSFSEAASMKSGIVGKWYRVEWYALGAKIEFLKDGTFINGADAGGYRLVDDNRIIIDGPFGSKRVLEASFLNGTWWLKSKEYANKTVIYVAENDKRGRQLAAAALVAEGFELLEKYLREAYVVPPAMDRFNKAIELDPDASMAYIGLAAAYSMMSEEGPACDWLSKAVKKTNNLDKLKDSVNNSSNFDKIRISNCYKKIMDKQKDSKLNLPEGCSVSKEPALSGLIDENLGIRGQYSFSNIDFFDNRGMARGTVVPYSTQYIQDYNEWNSLRAKTTLSLFSAPEGMAGSHRTMTLESGSIVKIFDAYSKIKQQKIFTALKDVSFDGLAIPKGAKLFQINPDATGCMNIFISPSFVGFRRECVVEGNTFKKTQETIVSTAYLLETVDGKRAWTRSYQGQADYYTDLQKDWVFCFQNYQGHVKCD